MRKYLSRVLAVCVCLQTAAQQKEQTAPPTTHRALRSVVFSPLPDAPRFDLPVTSIINEFRDGRPLFSTASRRSRLHGGWQSWYANGYLCDSGQLINELPHGEWKFWDKEGRLIAIRNYHAVQYKRVVDEIRHFNPRRNFYPLASLAQQDHPKAVFYLSAAGSFATAGPTKTSGTLRDLVLSNTSGEHYQPVFRACLHDGLFINYFSNGQVKDSGYYKNGLQQGPWLHRETPGGLYWEGAYLGGMRHREWKQYDNNGRLQEIRVYRKGVADWYKKYNE